MHLDATTQTKKRAVASSLSASSVTGISRCHCYSLVFTAEQFFSRHAKRSCQFTQSDRSWHVLRSLNIRDGLYLHTYHLSKLALSHFFRYAYISDVIFHGCSPLLHCLPLAYSKIGQKAINHGQVLATCTILL